MKPIRVGLFMAACAVTPAFAQTVHDIDARQQAVVAAWEQTPLSVRQRAKAVIRSTSLRMKPDSPAATACAAPIRAPSDNRPR